MNTARKPKDILEYKKGISGDEGQLYFQERMPYLDLASVAPSPSRDYYRVYVTKSEVLSNFTLPLSVAFQDEAAFSGGIDTMENHTWSQVSSN